MFSRQKLNAYKCGHPDSKHGKRIAGRARCNWQACRLLAKCERYKHSIIEDARLRLEGELSCVRALVCHARCRQRVSGIQRRALSATWASTFARGHRIEHPFRNLRETNFWVRIDAAPEHTSGSAATNPMIVTELNFSLFCLPHFIGARDTREAAAPKVSGCSMGRTCAVREEPGKQKPRSCRAQELARSGPRKMCGRKRVTHATQ